MQYMQPNQKRWPVDPNTCRLKTRDYSSKELETYIFSFFEYVQAMVASYRIARTDANKMKKCFPLTVFFIRWRSVGVLTKWNRRITNLTGTRRICNIRETETPGQIGCWTYIHRTSYGNVSVRMAVERTSNGPVLHKTDALRECTGYLADKQDYKRKIKGGNNNTCKSQSHTLSINPSAIRFQPSMSLERHDFIHIFVTPEVIYLSIWHLAVARCLIIEYKCRTHVKMSANLPQEGIISFLIWQIW